VGGLPTAKKKLRGRSGGGCAKTARKPGHQDRWERGPAGRPRGGRAGQKLGGRGRHGQAGARPRAGESGGFGCREPGAGPARPRKGGEGPALFLPWVRRGGAPAPGRGWVGRGRKRRLLAIRARGGAWGGGPAGRRPPRARQRTPHSRFPKRRPGKLIGLLGPQGGGGGKKQKKKKKKKKKQNCVILYSFLNRPWPASFAIGIYSDKGGDMSPGHKGARPREPKGGGSGGPGPDYFFFYFRQLLLTV